MKLIKLFSMIGIVLFIYIIYHIGISKILSTFAGVRIAYLFPAIIFLLIECLLLAYKWKVIIGYQGFKLNFIEAFKLNFIGTFYGFITPSRVGSLIRANYLREKTKKPLIECASGVVIERVFDLIAISLLAIIGAVYLANYFAGLFYATLLVFISFILIGFFFAGKKRARFVLILFYKILIPNKLKQKARDSFHLFYNSIPSIKKLVYPFLLTLITWIIAYTFMYMISLMLDVKVPYLAFIILMPISTIISLVPITVNGFGTREATVITLLKIFNVPAELALSMSLTSVIIGGALPSLIGFILSLKTKIKPAETENPVEAVEANNKVSNETNNENGSEN